MEEMNRGKLRKSIEEAELVLIGIGGQFSVKKSAMQEKPPYKEILDAAGADGTLSWIRSYLYAHYLYSGSDKSILAAYDELADMLQGKNYFIVTTVMDGMIYRSGLNRERIVAPCGGFTRLQCGRACGAPLYDARGYVGEVCGRLKSGNEENVRPVCPCCGTELVFNNAEAENYDESSYLPMWEKYRMWLQGTLNKRLCVIELGVGMEYPTVIRWPFEKVVFFNRKASFYRIHSKLYQLSEELKDRGVPVCADPVCFLTN